MEVFPTLLPDKVGALTQFELYRAHVYAHPEES